MYAVAVCMPLGTFLTFLYFEVRTVIDEIADATGLGDFLSDQLRSLLHLPQVLEEATREEAVRRGAGAVQVAAARFVR